MFLHLSLTSLFRGLYLHHVLYRLFLLLDNGFPLFLHHRACLLFHREYYRDNRASGGIHQVLFLLVVLNLPNHPTDKFVN